jgi:hypothetical protein
MEKAIMRTMKIKIGTLILTPNWMVASTLFLLLVLVHPRRSFAQDAQPRTFSSAAEASDALFEAAQKEDEPALEAILGAGKEVTSSNDEVEDKLEREHFSQKYQEMHRLVREPDGSTVLYIGAENWPFPLPLVSKDGAWYFDSNTGVEEITFRRIGENEATAIQVCNEFAMAKKQGKTNGTSGADQISRYAQNLVTGGSTNADGDRPSPFHGYYFRTLTGASAVADHNFASGGKKKGGVTLVAYPAEYRSSGVKTFVVSQDDAVYEKDLGPDTTTAAPLINSRSSGWEPTE